VPAAGSASPGAGAPSVASVLTPATRILLVEDNAINCMVIGGMLSRMGGSKPVIAGNGEEALARMAEATFDVILMDSQMPIMDGLEATRRLRGLGHTLPIIGLSAGALDEERQAALSAGANDYVLKPVDMPTLAAALARALGDSG
jgi:CheY-like chemotaxis protein